MPKRHHEVTLEIQGLLDHLSLNIVRNLSSQILDLIISHGMFLFFPFNFFWPSKRGFFLRNCSLGLISSANEFGSRIVDIQSFWGFVNRRIEFEYHLNKSFANLNKRWIYAMGSGSILSGDSSRDVISFHWCYVWWTCHFV